MSRSKPALTVLMTVRNGEPYLQEAVQSILGQTFSDFQFLILDNASTDNSREIIRELRDDRIELVELSHDIGQTMALNQGPDMIKTPWVARMDADDISLPRRLEKQMAYCAKHSDLVLLGTGMRWIDTDGQASGCTPLACSDTDLRWQLALGYGGSVHSAAVYKTEAAMMVGKYPEQYRHAQDYGLLCRLSVVGRVANIADNLLHVRRHGANTTDEDVVEREVRSIIHQQTAKLLTSNGVEEVTRVVDALRYDVGLEPGDSLSEILVTLPSHFKFVHGQSPSRSSLVKYALRWLQMARTASKTDLGAALKWMIIALRVQPALVVYPKLWGTLALSVPSFRYRNGSLKAASKQPTDE